MIKSPLEFVELRASTRQEDYLRAATDLADYKIWLDVISQFPEMRVWVARNKTVPLDVLAVLALDADPDVRLVVAMKNKLSKEIMVLLAGDPDEAVRHRIVGNKNIDAALLETLTHDPSELVSREALHRLALFTTPTYNAEQGLTWSGFSGKLILATKKLH